MKAPSGGGAVLPAVGPKTLFSRQAGMPHVAGELIGDRCRPALGRTGDFSANGAGVRENVTASGVREWRARVACASVCAHVHRIPLPLCRRTAGNASWLAAWPPTNIFLLFSRRARWDRSHRRCPRQWQRMDAFGPWSGSASASACEVRCTRAVRRPSLQAAGGALVSGLRGALRVGGTRDAHGVEAR